ncbi:hypothetical protein [Streptomyces sp. MZ04]|uniref:hypothetical protein n=1 Tax=Streptomyces sp. MZ04 TaxID=2559236 RepID=UPI00107EE543|nr:hypothetical protein [Streptomyces sp. MZ04]TGB08458.1 hypothetical protein E2651_19150 [Streptomyces sp. MZ04]
MRRGSLTLRGIAVAAALVAAAAPAHAHDQGKVHATGTPSSTAPGSRVEVSVTGCEGTTGSASSGAFTEEAKLTGRDGDKSSLNGSAMIKNGIAGTYDVTVICDGHPHQGAGTVQVVQHHQNPVAPVRAGGGGTAQLAVTAEEAGPGTRHAVIGLVLAGVAAVAVAFRSVRRRRSE